MSFVNTSVIFDSSPPLLNRMLLTNVPLLLPEKRGVKILLDRQRVIQDTLSGLESSLNHLHGMEIILRSLIINLPKSSK